MTANDGNDDLMIIAHNIENVLHFSFSKLFSTNTPPPYRNKH